MYTATSFNWFWVFYIEREIIFLRKIGLEETFLEYLHFGTLAKYQSTFLMFIQPRILSPRPYLFKFSLCAHNHSKTGSCKKFVLTVRKNLYGILSYKIRSWFNDVSCIFKNKIFLAIIKVFSSTEKKKWKKLYKVNWPLNKITHRKIETSSYFNEGSHLNCPL